MIETIEARVIYAEEAKILLENSLGKMCRALLELEQILDEIALRDFVNNESIIHSSLGEIRTQVASLEEYVSEYQVETLNGMQICQSAGRIVELFMQLDPDPSHNMMLKKAIIKAETLAVLANVHARELKAVEPFLERQPGIVLLYEDWSPEGMRDKLAEEFKARFPVFHGYKIETCTDSEGVWIFLTKPLIIPLKIDERVLEDLALKTHEFLKRELVNNPFDFKMHVQIFRRKGRSYIYDHYGRIYCLVRRSDWDV